MTLQPLSIDIQANVQPVVQACLRVRHEGELIVRAVEPVMKWAEEKWPGDLPPEARWLPGFEIDSVGFDIAAVALETPRSWGFRVRYTDPHTTGRSWEVEATVIELSSSDGELTVRSRCTQGTDRLTPASSPRFLRQWIERIAALDGNTRISVLPAEIKETAEVARLASLLCSADRELPVFVIAESPNGGWLVDPTALSRRTAGLAHVAMLRADLVDCFNNVVGKDLGIPPGSVRTYEVGFTELDDPSAHPLDRSWRIRDWIGTDGSGSGAYLDDLIRAAHRRSVGVSRQDGQFPSFLAVRRARADSEHKRKSTAIEYLQLDASTAPIGSEEQLRLLQAVVEQKVMEFELSELDRMAAESKASELDALFAEQARELAAVRQQRDQLRLASDNLRAGLDKLKQARPDAIPMPVRYGEVAAWVDQALGGRVVLLGRAQRALKVAQFEDLNLVLQCLQLLAREYWQWRTAGQDVTDADPRAQRDAARATLENRLREMGVDESPAISDSTRGKHKEQYEVHYEVGFTFVQVLDRHLRGGSDIRDPRYCLRIYFFWDDERQKVVIGHMPGHLDTLTS